MEPSFQDFLSWSNDKEVLKAINNEVIYFSNKIYKINTFKQERNLVLTNKSLYNFQGKKVKRQMKYEEMLGITFSNQSNEFVVHAKEGYDFHFLSTDKTMIIYLISVFYESIVNKPIILCQVNEKSLKQYVTTKKDKKKDINISRLDDNNKIDTQTFIIDNNPLQIKKRSNTESSGGKVTNIPPPKENPKFINNNLIFTNEDKINSAGIEDFEVIRLIGRGATSKVFLVKNKFNHNFYALKSLVKNYMEMNNEDNNLKKIKELKFPFLINTALCFETNEKVYFAFEYIQGEELFYNIKINKYLNEEKIKFYAGIISLTLNYLHNNGIEYKCFNSRNILIDKDGYLKLVPFHLWKIFPIKNDKNKKTSEKLFNECTPPEIFSEDNNSRNIKGADWWNLGIIIFEMAYGIPPFFSDDDNEMKNMIKNNELKFPIIPVISESLKDLINKLLIKNYEERLGYKNGIEEIKNHEFFKELNFDELLEMKIKPLYKPIIGDINAGNKKINNIFTYEDLQKYET